MSPFVIYQNVERFSQPTPSSLAEQVQWLRDRGAARIKHSGMTFLDHLAGTRDFLRQFGEPPAVVAAGLFHSAYGSSEFNRGLANPTDAEREALRGLIGPQAEELALLFGSIANRPNVLSNVALGLTRVRLRNGVDHDLSPDGACALLAIECANLLEQRIMGDLAGLVYHAQARGYLQPSGFCLARRRTVGQQLALEAP